MSKALIFQKMHCPNHNYKKQDDPDMVDYLLFFFKHIFKMKQFPNTISLGLEKHFSFRNELCVLYNPPDNKFQEDRTMFHKQTTFRIPGFRTAEFLILESIVSTFEVKILDFGIKVVITALCFQNF